jgi:hypothetical protein
MLSTELSEKITNIEPTYEKDILGGRFEVTFGMDNKFYLSFPAFLKYQFQEDKNLRNYIANRDADEVSASSIVHHLYDIGCPVEDWVHEYFAMAKSKVSKFEALLQLFNHIKDFGDDDTKQ